MIVSNAAEQRQQWLNGLKVGDEVAVNWGSRTYLISKVTRITPTRRFTVEGKGCTFGSDGVEMGASSRGWGYSRHRMYPVTEEIREVIARDGALLFIKNVRLDTLTTQQLLDVLKVIKPS